MKNFLLRNAWLLPAVGLSLVCDATLWAHTTPIALETLKQVGATAVVYKGPQVDVALSYRFPKYNQAGDWLLLDTAMTAAEPIEIRRAAISVRTPDGSVIPLASQLEFGKAYGGLAASIMRADAFREPLGYLIPRRARFMYLFSEPGRHVVFDSVWLDEWYSTYGRLYFDLPGGVQKGNYELLITLPESKVTILFTI